MSPVKGSQRPVSSARKIVVAVVEPSVGKRTLLGMEPEQHQLSDAELLESAIAGNSESFGLIFDRHHRRVLMQARRHVGSAVEAEDITGVP